MDREAFRQTLLRLRRYLMTGLIVIAPIFVTIVVLLWLFNTLDDILGQHLRPLLGRELPGVGLVALIGLLLLAGWASHKAVGKRLVSSGNRILSRFPLTRRIYNASSQIVQSVLDREEKLFQGVALIEYPMAGSWTVAFVTATAPEEASGHIGEECLSVFVPTVPNPATGWLLMLPTSKVRMLDMTIEEAFKLILSAGVAAPDREKTPSVGIDVDRLLRPRAFVPPPERPPTQPPGPVDD